MTGNLEDFDDGSWVSDADPWSRRPREKRTPAGLYKTGYNRPRLSAEQRKRKAAEAAKADRRMLKQEGRCQRCRKTSDAGAVCLACLAKQREKRSA